MNQMRKSAGMGEKIYTVGFTPPFLVIPARVFNDFPPGLVGEGGRRKQRTKNKAVRVCIATTPPTTYSS